MYGYGMVDFPKDIKVTKCKTETRTFMVQTKHGVIKHELKQPIESRTVKPVARRGKRK